MKKKTTVKKQPSREETLVVFLLDRTGSMASVKKETIGGFNGYLDTLLAKPESKDIRFHMVQFDSISLETLCDCVPLKEVARLSDDNYKPRAWTPLYDAIGKTIRAVEEKARGKKVLFVTSTDGQENSSSEWKLETVKALIKEKEDKDKWTFSYVGIGPEAWAANRVLAHGTLGASNVLRSTSANTEDTYGFMAEATVMCCQSDGDQSLRSVYGGKQLDEDKKK